MSELPAQVAITEVPISPSTTEASERFARTKRTLRGVGDVAVAFNTGAGIAATAGRAMDHLLPTSGPISEIITSPVKYGVLMASVSVLRKILNHNK